MVTAGYVLLQLAIFGIALVALQHLALARHLRASAPAPTRVRGISVLKPLCGVDDDLEENLERFALLDWPEYEVLLGIEHPSDPAYALARRIAMRWPRKFRVVFRRDEPGLNPKVNQLLTLAEAARHDVLVISDSNVRVDFDYLREISAWLEDEDVGLVTHPIAGIGEARIGSLFDNLHLAGAISSGTVAAKKLFGQDVVVGKSMAFRRADLEKLSLESVKDVLAEDYVLGRRVGRELGKRVALATKPVLNVTKDRGLSHFWGRYRRWAIIQRSMAGRPAYALQALLNPLPLAMAGVALAPSAERLAVGVACVATKIAIDAASARALRGEGFRARDLAWIPLKDCVAFAAWASAFVSSRVTWRGKALRVTAGTRLLPVRKRPGLLLTRDA